MNDSRRPVIVRGWTPNMLETIERVARREGRSRSAQIRYAALEYCRKRERSFRRQEQQAA